MDIIERLNETLEKEKERANNDNEFLRQQKFLDEISKSGITFPKKEYNIPLPDTIGMKLYEEMANMHLNR